MKGMVAIMIKMVTVKKQSVAFCKYVIAGLLWFAVILNDILPVYIVFIIMLISAFTGVKNAPLVKLFDVTFAKLINTVDEYINIYSMRFAHIVGCVFCSFAFISYYFISPIVALVFIITLAVLQTIAAFGYCSAAKVYECVVCNSNCCRFGKKIRKLKNNVR